MFGVVRDKSDHTEAATTVMRNLLGAVRSVCSRSDKVEKLEPIMRYEVRRWRLSSR